MRTVPQRHDNRASLRLENDAQIYVGGWRWVSRCNACGHVAGWVIDQNRQTVDTAVIVAS
jgi:hypothetical protein